MEAGKYQLIRKLATGGMAEVFLARAAGARGFQKTVVLKRILPHLAEDPHFTEMFLSEAKLAAQLNHANVVQIFDFGELDGSYFLAMEHIDGPNLRVLAKRAAEVGTPLAPAICARIISLACEGLAYAHALSDAETGEPLRLVHRDVTPDNILVSRTGGVKLVDFGIAKAVGQLHHTKAGVLKGKVLYMSPEQMLNKPLDLRADVYSLGVVFFELLAGRKPFEAEADFAAMHAILHEDAPGIRTIRPEVPEALDAAIRRALAKEREARFPTCLEFQAELDRCLMDQREQVGPQQLAQLVAQLVPPTATSGSHRTVGREDGALGTPVVVAEAKYATPIARAGAVKVREGSGPRETGAKVREGSAPREALVTPDASPEKTPTGGGKVREGSAPREPSISPEVGAKAREGSGPREAIAAAGLFTEKLPAVGGKAREGSAPRDWSVPAEGAQPGGAKAREGSGPREAIPPPSEDTAKSPAGGIKIREGSGPREAITPPGLFTEKLAAVGGKAREGSGPRAWNLHAEGAQSGSPKMREGSGPRDWSVQSEGAQPGSTKAREGSGPRDWSAQSEGAQPGSTKAREGSGPREAIAPPSRAHTVREMPAVVVSEAQLAPTGTGPAVTTGGPSGTALFVRRDTQRELPAVVIAPAWAPENNSAAVAPSPEKPSAPGATKTSEDMPAVTAPVSEEARTAAIASTTSSEFPAVTAPEPAESRAAPVTSTATTSSEFPAVTSLQRAIRTPVETQSTGAAVSPAAVDPDEDYSEPVTTLSLPSDFGYPEPAARAPARPAPSTKPARPVAAHAPVPSTPAPPVQKGMDSRAPWIAMAVLGGVIMVGGAWWAGRAATPPAPAQPPIAEPIRRPPPPMVVPGEVLTPAEPSTDVPPPPDAVEDTVAEPTTDTPSRSPENGPTRNRSSSRSRTSATASSDTARKPESPEPTPSPTPEVVAAPTPPPTTAPADGSPRGVLLAKIDQLERSLPSQGVPNARSSLAGIRTKAASAETATERMEIQLSLDRWKTESAKERQQADEWAARAAAREQTLKAAMPTVARITPAKGARSGGTKVKIEGTRLAKVTGVKLGGVPLKNLVVLDDGTVTGVTSRASEGTVDLLIEAPNGNLKVDAAFTYRK